MTAESNEWRISEEESRRISILKVWMSVMVVFIHLENTISTAGGPAAAAVPGWLDTLEFVISRAVSRCAIPAFFFLSAWLLYRKPFRWKQNIRKKIRSLLVPYLILNTFWIAVFFAGQHIPALSPYFSREETMVGSWGIPEWIGAYFGSPSNDWCPLLYPLWFIRNLFILNLLAPAFQWLVRKAGRWSLLLFVPVWLLTEENSIALSFCFWGMGCVFAVRKEPLSSLDKYRNAAIAYPLLILAVCLLRKDLGRTGPRIVYHFCLLAGMLFWYTCTTKIREGGFRKAVLFISKYSFCIYLFHEMNLTILRKVFVKILPQTGFFAPVQYFGPAAAVIAGCILLSRLLDRYLPKFYRMISGGRSR